MENFKNVKEQIEAAHAVMKETQAKFEEEFAARMEEAAKFNNSFWAHYNEISERINATATSLVAELDVVNSAAQCGYDVSDSIRSSQMKISFEANRVLEELNAVHVAHGQFVDQMLRDHHQAISDHHQMMNDHQQMMHIHNMHHSI